MSHPRNRPGGHLLVNTGEKITSQDLIRIGTMAEQTVYDLVARLLQSNISGNPIEGFFGDDCKVSISSGLTLAIAAGWGFFYDVNEAGEFSPIYKPIIVEASASVTLDAHSGNPRIDIVCLAPLLIEDQPETRSVKAGDGSISAQSVDKRSRWAYTLQVVKGSPSTSPNVPATPTGYLKLAEVRVPATTGAVLVRDTRGRLALGHDLRTEPSSDYAANFVPTGGGLLVSAGTGLSVVVVAGEAVIEGYRYRYPRQLLTITTADPSDVRYDAVVADADGTLQVLPGTPGFGLAPVPDADQVLLATVTVGAGATTVSVVDGRDATWLEQGSIKPLAVGEQQIDNGAVTGKKLSVTPVIPSIELSGTFNIQMLDCDGEEVHRSVLLQISLMDDDLVMEDGRSDTYRLSTISTGTAVTVLSSGRALVQTNSSGLAVLTPTFPSSGVAMFIKVEPLGTPGTANILAFTTP